MSYRWSRAPAEVSVSTVDGIEKRIDFWRYMLSSDWRKKAQKVIDRAKGCCERCGFTYLVPPNGPYKGEVWHDGTKIYYLTIHHLTYEHAGHEPLEDLQALCADCHRKADTEARRLLKGWSGK